MSRQLPTVVALAALAASFCLLSWGVVVPLASDWMIDDDYSHGLLIAPIALYMVWRRRGQLRATPVHPHWLGFGVITVGLGLLTAGVLGAELFATRIGLLGAVAGAVLFLCGPEHLRLVAFPLGLLLLTVPLPAIIFNQITLPLQLLASRGGEMALRAFQIPVLREGNVIVLPTGSLEVAEACSGIRSLMSLLSLGVLYGYLLERRGVTRVILAVATIPIAVIANGVRVAGTGVAAASYGPEVAEGFFHTFSGWLLFVMTFLLLLVLHQAVIWLGRFRTADAAVRRPAAWDCQ